MDEETKNRLRKRFDEILDSADAPLETLSDLESLALRLREQIAQATLDEAGHDLENRRGEERQAPADPLDPDTRSCVESCKAFSQSSNRASKAICPRCCHRSAWSKGDRSRSFVTLAGTVHLTRRYFYCRRCNQGFCPSDSRLGLPQEGGFTLRLTQEIACLSACLPFEQATQTLSRLTQVEVSPRSAERLCLGLAASQAESFRAQREAKSLPLSFKPLSALPAHLPRPDVLYVEADGIQTPMKGGHWREMKIGVVRATHRDGREAAASRYVNHLGDSETFGQHIESLAIDGGSLTARRVVILGDGAPWLWKLATTRFPRATQILDFWHALEYVGKVAREAFSTEQAIGDSGQAQEKSRIWLSARAAEMKMSAWAPFFVALKAVRHKAQESVATALRYFGNNMSRMDYARYLREGLSIGSGLAESSCKRIVTQRLKGSGMHWSEAGAQAVCALRCLLLGGEWSNFTNHWNRNAQTQTLSPLS